MARAAQLIEVFNVAKLRPAGPERDAFLAEACGDNAELKEQALSLLKADERAGGFMQAEPAPSPLLNTELLRFKPEKAGARIGPYTLREQLGEGGFGTVWEAEQQLPVRRTVALKIIKLGMDTRDVVARFEQERQALAVMDHPNIAKVLDAGATEEGRPYFVMELVRGIRITDYCDQANLPTPERLRLFIDVCHAVQHAHQKGIIHRDLKPSNILVTLQDGLPVPKVIDFGVAKATQGPLTELTIHTRAQEMVGTPLYMSPEQAEMNGLDVDTRTDIYALGVLLYELLTGRTPFDADTLRKAGYDEVRRIIREQEPQKPSTALHTMAQGTLSSVAHHRASEPPKLIHEIRGDLDWIVMKTLEKDRARRYDTANGLAADVRRYLENEPVTARPPSRAYQFQKLVRRNKLAFSAAVAITAALVAGFATATWRYFREREAHQRAIVAEKLATERLAEVSAERDAKEVALRDADAIATFMSEVFQSPNPARDGRTITVAESLDKAAQKLETDLADQPARRAKLRSTLGWTYFALGLPHSAVPLHEKALEYYQAALGPAHLDTIWVMHSLAVAYEAAGRRGNALKLREEVVARYRKLLPPEHPDMITATSYLADSYMQSGRAEEARQIREEVLALRRKVLGPEDPATLWAMHHLAASYSYSGRQVEALKLREEVLALRRKVLGLEHPDTLAAMQQVAVAYSSAGRHDEAVKLSEEVLTLRRKVIGPEHPGTLIAMHLLADSYAAAGRQDEALKMREETLALRRKALGPAHPDTLSAMQNLADSYAAMSRQDEALKLREETLALWRKVSGPEHVDTFTIKAVKSLADSYDAAGRRDEALKLREELLPLVWKVNGPEHRDTHAAMQNLKDLHMRAGQIIEVLPLLADASTRKPENTYLAMKVAALQVWFAKEAEHTATCQRMLQWAADTSESEHAERVAKIICLRPIDDASMKQAALALARRAVELRRDKKALLPWAHMTFGMAQYRSANYTAADEELTTALETASAAGPYSIPFIEGTASFYRVLSLFQQGKQAEARELFAATEAKMRPLPADEKNPLADVNSNHDDLILWLACKEARALLKIPSATER